MGSETTYGTTVETGDGGRLLAEQQAALRRVATLVAEGATASELFTAVVEEVVRATGASSPKDMGAVMKQCMARFAGKRVDGGKVSALVKQRLSAPPA